MSDDPCGSCRVVETKIEGLRKPEEGAPAQDLGEPYEDFAQAPELVGSDQARLANRIAAEQAPARNRLELLNMLEQSA
jgi:hypothetical protein